jgi:2-polyprenyl-3-methyl-5-hydroxy-6-metoxy-1,4-benzoquinol methylase
LSWLLCNSREGSKHILNKTCPICDENVGFKVVYPENLPVTNKMINYSGRKAPDAYHYEMVRCNRCNLLFANSIYDDDMVNKLYSDSAFDYENELLGLKKTYTKCLMSGMAILSNKNRMLDIGCGNGFMLEEAIKVGWKNVTGIELSSKAIDCANINIKQRIINKPFYSKYFNENHFDLIFSAMVIEHFTDINRFFSDVNKILRPGGVQVIIAHNESHFLSKLLKNKHPIINDEHVSVFSPKTLEKILQKHNFEIISIKSLKNYYPIKYWLKMLPINSKAKSIINKCLNKSNMGMKQIGIKAGNIVALVKKR